MYDHLREEIVRGRIRPNERLVELQLAARLETSRTPTREALLRLAQEGLVESRRRGWVVLEHDPQAIERIYEIRIALESFATRLAAERATDSELREISAIHDWATPLTVSRDDFVELNDRFHDAIFASSRNDDLREMIRRNARHYFSYRVARLYTDQELTLAARDHQRLVVALMNRDADAAEQIDREHLREALKVTLTKFW